MAFSNVIKRAALGLLFGFCMLLLATCLSWHALSHFDFFYPSLYQQLNIFEHIQFYAPNNLHKQGFETTDRTLHIVLFSGIVDAINSDGNGLDILNYLYQGSEVKLLTEAEITHLNDVANLVSKFNQTAWISLFILLLIVGFSVRSNQPLPKLSEQVYGAVGVLMLIIFTAASVGFVPFFYFLHELIFPEGNQWFFYYQESLMSTLMKAPDLFLPISGLLLVLSTTFYGLLCYWVYLGYRKMLALR